MFKKTFALVILATALFASPVTSNRIDPVPDCFPCDFSSR
jgi:hypothetical protein